MATEEVMASDKAQEHPIRIQIDRVHYEVSALAMTGAQLRAVPQPPQGPIGVDRDLFLVIPGGTDNKIADDEVVKLHNGMRFFTAPAQINPGHFDAAL
ncbi:multiubiquitin domain-containing protein [Pelomonas sp. SE-A7]|uniref:multiubiquitin domain-containing protein n=1 Tax=Pelomonas sp. SE-A7 TaxID=3054953 RepID=UPI00259CB263|nr:multiubiquitin domain-containing protein [Pelomonas sp. SE-A7]MDM4768267.1 multiubiquitin domain-containing protein [Pelomonas sp. SE-A7]